MTKSIILALLVMVWLVSPVWAVEPGRTAKTNTSGNSELRCKLTDSKIDLRLNQYERDNVKHTSIYTGVRKRVAALVIAYESRGCDVASLKADLTKFDTLITDFGDAYRVFVGSMKDTRNYTCGESQGKFAAATKTARQKLENVRQKSLAVHEYFKSTIQPHLTQKAKACNSTGKQ